MIYDPSPIDQSLQDVPTPDYSQVEPNYSEADFVEASHQPSDEYQGHSVGGIQQDELAQAAQPDQLYVGDRSGASDRRKNGRCHPPSIDTDFEIA